MEVATEIYNQLGGNQFKAMVGAKHLTGSKEKDNFLSFSFPMCKKANKCTITLNSMDTYDVEFFKLNRKTWECPSVETFNGIYNDQLTDIFTAFTGLNTHL